MTDVSTGRHAPDVTPQQRINRLVEAKAVDTTAGQIDYLDLLFTELAQYCATLDRVYALADLLDTAMEEICWARLRKPTTGALSLQQGRYGTPTRRTDPEPADGRTAP
jgi:hypothetical protein